ncbi:MAG: hypothetical protein AAF993_11615 [Pseudomonadota bacterium]
MNRRQFVQKAGALTLAGALPLYSWAQGAGKDNGKDKESPLIYLSTIKSNGALSKCQAEVWFVQDGADQYVVTARDAWRAQAVRQGLTRTQVWVGDVGQWQSAGGAYLELPSHFATASFSTDAAEHTRLLSIFGQKYSDEWGSWGPRFRNGLASGERVMLRYRPA